MLGDMATITKTEVVKRPMSFWKGWAVTMAVGILVGAYIGALMFNLPPLLWPHVQIPSLLFPLEALPVMLFAIPTACIFGFIPISLTYCVARAIIGHLSSSTVSRLLLGLVVGIFWASIELLANPESNFSFFEMNISTLIFQRSESVPVFMTSIIMALIMRRTWLGVA